ncbi:hypothetical protein JHK85_005946 [Glycine max]|uniref:Uncharacterized protein n=1 Tax=Glycine soja TaxID=3848 RepID=A0A0B2SAT6_GLYSO|nr:hypothetical protein JHK85_005946 [Glycine max]KHN43871.1 hypothetical protein glysoja_025910 [Glycine soja]
MVSCCDDEGTSMRWWGATMKRGIQCRSANVRHGEVDGPIAKELIPKLTIVRRNLSSKLGVAILDIDVQPVIASTILLKRVGGILFVLGSTFGSYLLFLYLGLSTPILYDFYNYRSNIPEYYLFLNDFIQLCANYFLFPMFLSDDFTCVRTLI